MRKYLFALCVIGVAPLVEQLPGFDVAFVSRAGAQVTIVGGTGSFGFSNGFGSFGSQTSYTSGTTLIATPGMTVGTVTYGPYGAFAPYSSFYAGSGPYVGYVPGGYGYGWGGYPYSPYFGGWGGYWRRPYYGFGLTLAPSVLPAEWLYGPGPVRRMMGLDPPLGTPIVNTTIVNNPQPVVANRAFGVDAGGAQVPKANIPATNAAARERSRRQLAIGDDAFRKQNYGEAWLAYKEAARAAPDVADAYFHQAGAAVAQKRYEAAVDAVKFGLRISTSYLNGEFKYAEMYGNNKLTHTAHLEALAQAATDRPSSDLYFLTGVMLFFDAEPRRSTPFFARARELAIDETWHIDVFSEILRRMEQERGPLVDAAPVDEKAPVRAAPQAADVGQEI